MPYFIGAKNTFPFFSASASAPSSSSASSLLAYLRSEVTRGYQLENDQERYQIKREKVKQHASLFVRNLNFDIYILSLQVYTFLKIPRELEKFMSYGFFHCLDSFLFVFTFLPIRCGHLSPK